MTIDELKPFFLMREYTQLEDLTLCKQMLCKTMSQVYFEVFRPDLSFHKDDRKLADL